MNDESTHQLPDRNLALELVRVTEAAAMAAGRWVGRGDKIGADGAAVNAMRRLINTVSMDGVVVIGEGEKDNAPMLFNGEHVGNGVRYELPAPDPFLDLLPASGIEHGTLAPDRDLPNSDPPQPPPY